MLTSTVGTTLLQIPYGVFIALVILFCVWINDKMPPNSRCLMILVFLFPNIAAAFGLRFVPRGAKVGRLICYYVMFTTNFQKWREQMLILSQLTGSYNASFVMLLSLTTANIAGHTKKVTSSACLFVGYCVGNIVGPFFYKSNQAPEYSLGIWSMIVSHLLEVVVVAFLWILLKRENQRRDNLQNGPSVQGEGSGFDVDLSAFSDMTDKENPNFRYVY